MHERIVGLQGQEKPAQDCFIEGSLAVKLPTIWAHGKAEVGKVREEKE
jgi:hypothetical protein